MSNLDYNKAITLLHKVATLNGFLASAEDTTNYKRIWARDGVICGLAALASRDEKLILTFRNTLETLASNQHSMGTIPSNVDVASNEISYGGLAGRVDAVTWFIIGVCNYSLHQKDLDFLEKYKPNIEKGFQLLNAWEYNNKHLIYTPLSGNWADEYITDGYVLYDQLLRVWALKSYNHFIKSDEISTKIQNCTTQIQNNFLPNSDGVKFHERAYNTVKFQKFLPCSFSPSGYKTQFDAFANSLFVLLKLGTEKQQQDIIEYSTDLASDTNLGLIPAFWPPIYEQDEHWNLLKNNCKYEFRNFPYEFHNAGSWTMVNGFFGLALLSANKVVQAKAILEKINAANAVDDYSFYENFNTETQQPKGVAQCAWSAASTVILHQSIHTNFKFLL